MYFYRHVHAGIAGFVEFFFWLIISQRTWKAAWRHYTAKHLMVQNRKNDASSEQREMGTIFILFPGSIWTGLEDLISFLAGSLKFFVCFKWEVSISLSMQPLYLLFAGFCKLDHFPWPGTGYPFHKYWPCGVLKWLRKGMTCRDIVNFVAPFSCWQDGSSRASVLTHWLRLLFS